VGEGEKEGKRERGRSKGRESSRGRSYVLFYVLFFSNVGPTYGGTGHMVTCATPAEVKRRVNF